MTRQVSHISQVELDPMGNRMRSQNHHTIYEAGFTHFGAVLRDLYQNPRIQIAVSDRTVWAGRQCLVMTVENPDFGFYSYQSKGGESIRDIAKKRNLNQYKIIEMNPKVKKYQVLAPGTVIKIPNSYAKKMELLIDLEFYLPIQQKIYDEKGIFEIYQFKELEYNPFIDEEEFALDSLSQR